MPDNGGGSRSEFASLATARERHERSVRSEDLPCEGTFNLGVRVQLHGSKSRNP